MEDYRFLILILMIFTLYACNERKEDCSGFVNVFIGTAGDGHTWPGACLPSGMVQLSPDTRLVGRASCGGYYSVMLDDYNVKVELTATARCGSQMNFYFERGFHVGGVAWYEPSNVLDILLAGEIEILNNIFWLKKLFLS